MNRLIRAISKWIAGIVLGTLMASQMAMAMYVCPEIVKPPVVHMMDGVPCHEMDPELPVHCAAEHLDVDLFMHQLDLDLTIKTKGSVYLAVARPPSIVNALSPVHSTNRLLSGNDPPYLATLRLRV